MSFVDRFKHMMEHQGPGAKPKVNEDTHPCPDCGHPNEPTGDLGITIHYRCKKCGKEYSREGRVKDEAKANEEEEKGHKKIDQRHHRSIDAHCFRITTKS